MRWLLISAAACSLSVGCGGDGDDGGGGTARVNIDLVGCPETVTALSLLIRVEGTDGGNRCTVDELCLDVTYTSATVDEIEATLRSQGFPLFDLPADSVERVTVGLSATAGCPLGIFTQGCGSVPIDPNNETAVLTLDCSAQPACADVSGQCPASIQSAPPEGEALEILDGLESTVVGF